MVPVKFVQEGRSETGALYNKDEVAGFPEAEASKLVADGKAVYLDQPAPVEDVVEPTVDSVPESTVDQ